MKYTFDPFFVEYNIRPGPTYDFEQECILAAEKCVENNRHKKPIIVSMSGGIDSEIVARSFLLAGIPFKAGIVRLCTRVAAEYVYLNSHDYQLAEYWCNQHNVEIVYCNIDIYAQSGLLTDYAISSYGFSPQFACIMLMMKWYNIQGFYSVFGCGDIDIVLKEDEYFTVLDQREFTLDIFAERHGIDCTIRFYTQDQKLTSALINLPSVQKLMKEQCPALVYRKHEYLADVFSFEPRNKYTGYESVQEWDNILRTKMKDINGRYDDRFYTPITFFE